MDKPTNQHDEHIKELKRTKNFIKVELAKAYTDLAISISSVAKLITYAYEEGSPMATALQDCLSTIAKWQYEAIAELRTDGIEVVLGEDDE